MSDFPITNLSVSLIRQRFIDKKKTEQGSFSHATKIDCVHVIIYDSIFKVINVEMH